MREEAHLLDHIADATAQLDGVDGGYVVPPVEEYPALGRFDQPVHHLHGGRLAAARRSDERDQFTLGDLEGKVVDGGGAVRIPLGDVLETDHGSPPLSRVFCEGHVAGIQRLRRLSVVEDRLTGHQYEKTNGRWGGRMTGQNCLVTNDWICGGEYLRSRSQE